MGIPLEHFVQNDKTGFMQYSPLSVPCGRDGIMRRSRRRFSLFRFIGLTFEYHCEEDGQEENQKADNSCAEQIKAHSMHLKIVVDDLFAIEFPYQYSCFHNL